MIPAVKQYLGDNWSSLNMGERPADLFFIKFADRRIRAAEVAVVSFLVKGVDQHGERPLMVLRFPRYPDNQQANLSLELEYQNLRLIQGKVGEPEILAAIPVPVLWQTINHSRVLAISFLPGAAMSQSILAQDCLKRYVENFALTCGWLVAFQKALGSAGGISPGALVDKVIAEYHGVFPGQTAALEKYFTKLKQTAQVFSGFTLPLYPQHNDLHAENIFLLNNQVSGVVDWEDFEPQGVPAFDIIHFSKTYFEALLNYFAGQNNLELVETLSARADTLVLVKAAIDNYLAALGIDPALVKILVPLYLLKSACLAGCARKKASGALKKLEILLQLGPDSVEDLFLFQSVFNYGDLHQQAQKISNPRLAELCRHKILEIQNIAKTNQQV